MSRIRLLSETVANQIAAGEVVERPASVVKELVENALDAGAHRIRVEIQAGGRSLIRVTDDGTGMNRDDALLCLERHATSKIRHAEDLQAIATMGFRGEALPSIASVSRFTLVTRERDDTSGEATRILVTGGRIDRVETAAGPPGTSVEVRQLFFNLPARRKFLRTQETERAHIQHTVTLAALAHPQVAFALVHEGRPVWQLPAVRWTTPDERSQALRERLRQLQGGDTPLLPVDFQTVIEERRPRDVPDTDPEADPPSTASFRVWGFVGAPGVSRGNRDEHHLFVNRRPIDNRGLNHALLEGYHNALMKGRYPVCCLFIEIDPAAVDVNIHPSKREVKFREEPAVRRLTARAIQQALVDFARQTPPPPPPERSPTGPAGDTAGPWPSPAIPEPDAIPPFHLAAPPHRSPQPAQARLPLVPGRSRLPTVPVPPSPGASRSRMEPHEAGPATGTPPGPGSIPPLPGTLPTPLLQVPLRLIGVLGRLYVLLESDRGLVLMDQHAAHERILYEQMLTRMQAAAAAPSQRLLLPETIELAPRDAQLVRSHLETFQRLGVGLREFGERTFLLDAIPPFVRTPSPAQFARDLITELQAAGPGINTLRLGEDMIAKTVCRHAVKANDFLNPAELETLVDDLRRCEMPYTCPHGRPTLIEMSWRELERKFGRTQ